MEKNEIKNLATYPRFVENNPCGQDLFEGKSQDNIANSISSLLQSNDNCKIIGIDGGWGSGKSNLVYQVKNKVNGQFHFFIYDAWGHQEDLQRRAILEELTDDLVTNKLLPNSWQNKLKQLLAKTREIETKSIPKLSYGIIISGLAIILTPICKIVADAIDEEYFYIRLSIVLLPILLLLITVICYWISERGLKRALSKMYILYQNKQREDTTYETISEVEPSVRKFKDWIGNVSNDLNKKVVLVFDNMDRLPKEKVQQLWSSIHVFFAETSYENIRVIIPFDREHIKSAFKSEDINGQNGNKCFGNDFIDKTFKVVYRVSPPIMSDWKKYFKEQWENAFGVSSYTVDYNRIVQIFDLLSDDITPRKIIAFINEFVSIKLIAQDSIPDRYIGLFIFGKQKLGIANPLSEIISPTYLKSIDFLYGNDEEMPKYIASLYFQVAPQNANQIVFTDKLKKALNDNRKEDIVSICKIPNFYSLLENAIAEVSNFENATLALSSISNEEIGSAIQSLHIWNCIYKKVQFSKYSKVEEWQLKLLKQLPDKDEFTLKIIDGIQLNDKLNAKNYCESIDNIIPVNQNVLKLLQHKVLPIEDWIQFVRLKQNSWKQYKLFCNQEELDEYFTRTEFDLLDDFSYIPFIKKDYKLDTYIKKIEGLISEINGSTALNEAEMLFELYKRVADKPLVSKLSDDIIYSFFTTIEPESDFYYELLAMRIAKLGSFNVSYAPYFEAILNDQSNDSLVKEVASRIEYYLDLGSLLLGLQTFKDYPLYKSVVRYLVANPSGSSRLMITSVLAKFDIICQNGEIESEALIKRLNSWSDSAKKEINGSNLKAYANKQFVLSALSLNNELTSHILTKLEEYLNSINLENWNKIFNDTDSYEFDIILKHSKYRIPQNAIDAIKETFLDIANQSVKIPDKAKWIIVIERLRSQNRGLVTIFNNIRDVFCRQGNITVDLFDFFGDWLFKYSKLEERKETLRTIFKSQIVRNNNNLRLMLENNSKMIKIVEIAGDESIDFKDLIQELLKTNTDKVFIEFANQIGVKKEQKNYIAEKLADVHKISEN